MEVLMSSSRSCPSCAATRCFPGSVKTGTGARESGQLMPEAYVVENMCREKGGMRIQVPRTLGSE